MLAGHRRRSITMRPARSWRRASPGRLGYHTSGVRGFATYRARSIQSPRSPVGLLPRPSPPLDALPVLRCRHRGVTDITAIRRLFIVPPGGTQESAKEEARLSASPPFRPWAARDTRKTDRSWECPASGRCAHSGPQQHTITQARRVNGRLQLTGGPCAEILGEEDDILSAQQIYADPDHRCSKIVASLV